MENFREKPPQSSQDYYPYYNLFQSSIFYDTDNFRIASLTHEYDDSLTTESGIKTFEYRKSEAEHDDSHTDCGPECSEGLSRSTEPLEKEGKESDEEYVEPEREKRIITKAELYRDPDLFQSRSEYVDPNAPANKKPKPWGYYDWTRQIWVRKDTEKRVALNKRDELNEEQREEWGEQWREERRGEWRAVRGSSPQLRVLSNAAVNTTQRTGWRGRALGKVGDGIPPQITMDPNYGSRNVHSGKRSSEAKAKPLKPKKLSNRDVFRTNVLLFIMEFIKDDTEIQLQFDSGLKQCERRHIKTIVSHIIAEGNIAVLSSVGQYDLVHDIQTCNQYQLSAVSEGDTVTRYLCIYKEAPAHVYLVTPDDFLPKEDDETDAEQADESSNKSVDDIDEIVKDGAQINNNNEELKDLEDDDNPFLKSIQKNLKKHDEQKIPANISEKDCNITKATVKLTESTPEEKVLEFFLEFVDSGDFTEMWFLGKFTEKQVQVINELLNDLSTCIDDLDSFTGDEELAKVFKSGELQLELKEGSNGTTEIHKVSADPLPEGEEVL